MKLRQSFALVPPIALALIAAPAALTEAGLEIFPGAERVSFAQGASPSGAASPSSSDGVTEIARQRYQEGVRDYDAGRYEEARSAFLQAYALKRTPAVLLNVALSELRSPVYHADEAGNHFQQFLREATTATPEQRATAEKSIADAKKRAGIIFVSVDASGADVSIDGTSVGKAPLPDPVFVKPGKHTIFAQIQGKSAVTVVDIKAGANATATLTTGVTVPASPTGPVASSTHGSSATPGGMGDPSRSQPYPPGAGGPGAGSSTGAGVVLGAGAGDGPDKATSTREPFGRWYARKPLAWVGTGLTGVGLIIGVSASVAAGLTSARTADHVAQIKKENRTHPEFNPDRRDAICGDEETGKGALSHYAGACAIVRADVSNYNTSVAVAVTGWVLFGVGAVGTGILVLTDWYPKKAPPATAFQPRVLAVTPILSPTEQGIGVVGSF